MGKILMLYKEARAKIAYHNKNSSSYKKAG